MAPTHAKRRRNVELHVALLAKETTRLKKQKCCDDRQFEATKKKLEKEN